MSTRASKKSASSSSSESIVQSSHPSTSTPINRRSRSPLSPTRYTRLQEKQDLQNLNDRLACYIDKVRHLETENSRLLREIKTTDEINIREVTNIKSIYERELTDTRKLLDDTARDRAKLEIDTKRLWEDNEDLKAKLDKKIKDLHIAERNASVYESRFNELQSQVNQAHTERKKLAEREQELETEIERLKALLDDSRKHLQEETLQRIELENNIQTYKEDLSFKDQIYQQELTETRTRRQSEITEIDGRLAEQYEMKLQQSLKELRDEHEAQMRANKENIESLYENKINNLTAQAQRDSRAASRAMEEIKLMRTKMDGLTQKINELEATNYGLNSRNRELENLRESERAHHAEALASLEAEKARIRDEMAHQLQEYQDLMDIKIALDLEIAAYRKLLESEEARLNITPASNTISSPPSTGRNSPARHTPLRSVKRKRTFLDETDERSSTDYSITGASRGDIEIAEVDPQGRYVKLINKGKKEIPLSGWRIMRKAGTLETIFKFHRTTKIDSGATIMLWSANVGATHEPPSNIVMKDKKWITADTMTTTLINHDGDEMATSECKCKQLSTSRSRHQEHLSSQPLEDLHYQMEDAKGELCRVM